MEKQKERTPWGRSFSMGKNQAKSSIIFGLSNSTSAGDV